MPCQDNDFIDQRAVSPAVAIHCQRLRPASLGTGIEARGQSGSELLASFVSPLRERFRSRTNHAQNITRRVRQLRVRKRFVKNIAHAAPGREFFDILAQPHPAHASAVGQDGHLLQFAIHP